MVNKSIIDTAVKYIQQIPSELEVKKAFLFGSYAKGLEKEDSDIDIAIVIKNMTDFFSVQMELMRARRDVDLRIEPHPIAESDFTNNNSFAFEIQKYGVKLEIDGLKNSLKMQKKRKAKLDVLAGLQDAVNEVNRIKKGKRKKTLQEILDKN